MKDVSLELQILEAVEAREDPLLSWGIVDGGLATHELITLVDDLLLRNGDLRDADEVMEDLLQRGLIVRDDTATTTLWRSRNGETLRLLARSRQIFLSNDPETAWRNGATLVADFRYARRPRVYPVRDQAWTETLLGVGQTNPTHSATIEAMTRGSEGQPRLLAGFQVRATRQVLTSLQSPVTSATVVGAGTGSGKTLAFYLPAFAYLAGLRDRTVWTRALAVYPRNELLKDQLNTAFAAARRLDHLWVEHTGRKLTLGVLNGGTPHTPASVSKPYLGWVKSARGYRSPHLVCPGDGSMLCGGDLYWSEEDVRARTERLTCARCGRQFDESVVSLTRTSMSRRPPDILFTTTEMLNRGLSDLSLRPLLGVGQAKKPRLALLDEIHTYEGMTGAQAAMVLRRWHHALQGTVAFVGLSATLSNAVRHMADLCGVADDSVTSIEPTESELEYEGAEYLVALRSDPTSGAAVLSSTIQAAILLPRTLDDPLVQTSNGVYGTKVFVFTDDLDVTNRLYSYVLDAEGQRVRSGGRVMDQYKDPLASMRRAGTRDVAAQRRAGQVWDLPIQIGHRLGRPGLRIGRTTSQDSGVDPAAQVVIATSSLDVGYDDSAVGTVLQHKAPRGVATFVQRKGRAGRTRQMRPYTVVVLSDYGRDRAAYEAWDALFDPVLPKTVLPTRNRAVLRMQATIAMLDWLASQVAGKHPAANLWRDLREIVDPKYQNTRLTQESAVAVLRELLRDPSRQRSLREWIRSALQISENAANELLWHPPRPLLLSAVPTLARRVHNEWAVAGEQGTTKGKDTMGGNPLPDFFPNNLFTELSLPEVQLVVPPQSPWETEPELQSMSLAQALREFAPGRISHRFATRNPASRHWIPLEVGADGAQMALDAFLLSYRYEEDSVVDIGGRATRIRVARPGRIRLENGPPEVRDNSNASLGWRSQFVEAGPGLATRIPASDPVGQLVREATFFLHAQHSHVEVRRVAVNSEARLLFQAKGEARVRSTFSLGGDAVGLGATYDVDGLRLTVELPPAIRPSAEISPGLRGAWFRHVLINDPVLLERMSSFQISWLHEILESMLLMEATATGLSIADAYARARASLDDRLDDTLSAMFRSPDVLGTDSDVVGRTGQRLRALINEKAVLDRLDELIPQYWQPDDKPMEDWLRRRLLATIGEAALWAASEICPEQNPEGLIVDVEPGFDQDGVRRTGQVWLTESTIGGGGFIESLASRVRPDPRRFLRLISRATQPSTADLVDTHMRRLVNLINEDAAWRDHIAAYRQASDQQDRVKALGRIRDAFRSTGIHGAEHAVVSSLANRLLRPGSSSATDSALRAIVEAWTAEEERLGVEIPVRTWAYLRRADTSLDAGLNLGPSATERQRLDAVQSLLWPRGWRLRAEGLRSWNPYHDNDFTLPDLLREILHRQETSIDVVDSATDAQVRETLAVKGSAILSSSPEHVGLLSSLIVGLSTIPITTEYLQVYPKVVEVLHRADGTVVAALELAEVAA
ncbi:hypothetical protein GCM10023322_52150 [Rugosimonospora acidiphila]|uniref:DEAD/DEAH box helicase n=1 Tax=Rugosimonospora acidiphila TaxID=556531 RepID=A0ABP9S7R4_9ACTN